MVENILATLSNLKGVHHAGLYRDDKGLLSSFPEDYQNINALAQNIEQIFSALQATEKSHNELYFSVEDNLLAAYLMHNSYIAILLTDKNINFPLVRMGIRSASLKIEQHLELISKKDKSLAKENNTEPLIKISHNEPPPIDEELELIMTKLLEELINYFGPAAKFVFEDALIQWEVHYIKNRDNIPELGKILLKEMDTPQEKSEFLNFLDQILQ
jgi:predicted regulator of Ras-like GTPase activity (Roadblock/LC7/MglB family)